MRIELSVDSNNSLEVLPDSPEQIAGSIKKVGLPWNQLCETFRAAIARVNKGQQESARPAIHETRKGESEDEAPVK